MLTARVIPCLDVRDGRVVKGVRFSGVEDAGDPVELARRYEAEGADELCFLDIAATPAARETQREVVRRVRRELSIPLTVGGGVRTPEDAAGLLTAGADKVGVNTAAVLDPSLVEALSARFGAQCAVVAVDAARREDDDGWEVVTHGGRERTGRDALDWCAEAARRGAGELLLTSWDRDGTRAGYDLDLLREVTARVPVPVIASGGADGAAHMVEALRAGASAVLAASIFHRAEVTVGSVKDDLARAGWEVRS